MINVHPMGDVYNGGDCTHDGRVYKKCLYTPVNFTEKLKLL